MKEVSGFAFPANAIEAKDWTRRVDYRALACNVLAVATTRIEGTWSAYIKAVAGYCHDDEWQNVLTEGDKLQADIAKVIFPRFAEIPYAP